MDTNGRAIETSLGKRELIGEGSVRIVPFCASRDNHVTETSRREERFDFRSILVLHRENYERWFYSKIRKVVVESGLFSNYISIVFEVLCRKIIPTTRN